MAAQDNGKFLSFHGHEVKLVDADGIFFVFDLTKKVRLISSIMTLCNHGLPLDLYPNNWKKLLWGYLHIIILLLSMYKHIITVILYILNQSLQLLNLIYFRTIHW